MARMKKRKLRTLSPELEAKYQEWIKGQAAAGEVRYAEGDEIDMSAATPDQIERFKQWLGDDAGDVEYEEEETGESEE
jgi:hypothetical protein